MKSTEGSRCKSISYPSCTCRCVQASEKTQCYSRTRPRSIPTEKQSSHQYLKTNTNTTNTGPKPILQHQNFDTKFGIGACLVQIFARLIQVGKKSSAFYDRFLKISNGWILTRTGENALIGKNIPNSSGGIRKKRR